MRPARITARITARSARDPRACDCLDRCGDDPRLARGEVDRCAESIERDRQRQEGFDRITLSRELALHGALSLVRGEAVPITTPDGSTWLSLDECAASERAALHRAGRYLLLTRHAEAHPTRPHLLRLVGTAATQPQGPQRPAIAPKEHHA